jgi:hypothetical protein
MQTKGEEPVICKVNKDVGGLYIGLVFAATNRVMLILSLVSSPGGNNFGGNPHNSAHGADVARVWWHGHQEEASNNDTKRPAARKSPSAQCRATVPDRHDGPASGHSLRSPR